jgi:diguanylate cyclase (GGDEF)-like protein
MLPPNKPDNERARLAALQGLQVLDTSPEERFDRITRIARKLFNVPIALVSLVDEDRQWFKSRQGLDVTETSRDVSFCGHAILTPDTLVVPDAQQDNRFHDNPLVTGDSNIRFYAGCPLELPDETRVGTLCIIDHEPRQLTREDLDVLSDLAALVRRELTALQLATVDELTGICNRRGFECLAAHALEMCRRLDEPASLYYLDLDGFKRINDGAGHQEGDQALKEFARALNKTFRDSDVLGRIGGDEFAVLVTNSSDEGSKLALQRLNRTLSDRELRPERGYDIHYSVGVLHFDPAERTSISDLMNKADQMMYQRKRAKR